MHDLIVVVFSVWYTSCVSLENLKYPCVFIVWVKIQYHGVSGHTVWESQLQMYL